MKKTIRKFFRIKDHPEASHLWDPEKMLELFLEEEPLDFLQEIVIIYRRKDGTVAVAHSAMDGLMALGLTDAGQDMIKESFKND